MTTPSPAAAPAAERRLVSVLFADLVGFTSLSESRDAEEVRELLTRYFDASRDLIGRYGGTIEKFIGDAVMAVWGAPVAREDDAERAVRAALDLVQAVSTLGSEVGAPGLRARAAVSTGEAAVTIGAEGQGMVAGDLVNTTSRMQSAADPGTVVVGEATRRASEASIAYEQIGAQTFKGKTEAIPLWRALRVVAARGGLMRSSGLEAPFVGREREMRLAKELFHASADEGKGHLLSVIGVAGIGKSRLSWELEKYMDGLLNNLWWHRGRCLSYGEGVTYWALAEMVRMRARIAEEDDADTAMEKLRDALAQHVPDIEERAWIEPHLAHLLGLRERGKQDRDELFSAWRTFFQRMAETSPVIMVFEDLQWADAALLDFIEYLIDWVRSLPIFVVTQARPELAEKRPQWGAGKRNFTSIYLEPLSDAAVDELLRGLVPGLPDDLRVRIRERSEGIPLYAVETVRMLLDRGLLERHGNAYRPTGKIPALEVPETLHALIAARLDGLMEQERRLLQDGSVLGKSFTKTGLSALTGIAEEVLDELLAGLVRKEILSFQSDPRSPERGQYSFLQALVKQVAYETLAKKDRKVLHLAAAKHLRDVFPDEDEIAEVLASHYLNAFELFPDASDAGEIKEEARKHLERAGARASSLAATLEAQHYFEQAASLASDVPTQAGLLEQAGQMAWNGNRMEDASRLYDRAIELYEGEGLTHPAARVSARRGEIDWFLGDIEPAVARMERSFAVLVKEEQDADLAALAAQIARFQFFTGDLETSLARVELALEIAETKWLPGLISEGLQTKANILAAKSRREESLALLERGLKVALENDYPIAAARAYVNLSDRMVVFDRYDEAIAYTNEGGDLATRIGAERFRWAYVGNAIYPLFLTGEWDDAFARIATIPMESGEFLVSSGTMSPFSIVNLLVARGRIQEAQDQLGVFAHLERSTDLQDQGSIEGARAVVARATGDPRSAMGHAIKVMEGLPVFGIGQDFIRESFVELIESALSLGELETAEGWIDRVKAMRQVEVPVYLRGQISRFEARLMATRGTGDPEPKFREAIATFRDLGVPFHQAMTATEWTEWLIDQDRASETTHLLDEAVAVFEKLGAVPWIERIERAAATI
ncbi:MAG TPA: adenylate/guanylate cyclase domain-containing protein [Actinomycetota bacterium]|nr:adenylate/guanylate cyclase domain-containing protein [Actinomycetota bacterium]